jgi:hypothetical protein
LCVFFWLWDQVVNGLCCHIHNNTITDSSSNKVKGGKYVCWVWSVRNIWFLNLWHEIMVSQYNLVDTKSSCITYRAAVLEILKLILLSYFSSFIKDTIPCQYIRSYSDCCYTSTHR